jgi:hypothetical protein
MGPSGDLQAVQSDDASRRWRDSWPIGGVDELFRQASDPWSSTLPRQLVHRQTVADVLVTAIAPLGAEAGLAAAQWARAQPFYRGTGGRFDTTLILETLRQAGLALCHRIFEVPHNRQFLLRDLRLDILDPRYLLVGDSPAQLVLSCAFTELRLRGQELRSGRVIATCYRDGALFAHASSAFACVDPVAYSRLRRGHSTQLPTAAHGPACSAAASATEIGRTEPEDVVLCTCARDVFRVPRRFGLRVDPRHPSLFDHPLDHVPGMAVLEACRQAAGLARGSRAATETERETVSIEFLEFVPLQGLTSVEVSDGSGNAAVVTVTQGELVLAEAEFGIVDNALCGDDACVVVDAS